MSRRTGQAGTVVQHSKTWDERHPPMGSIGRICRAVPRENGAPYRLAFVGQNPSPASDFESSSNERASTQRKVSPKHGTSGHVPPASRLVGCLSGAKASPGKAGDDFGLARCTQGWLLPIWPRSYWRTFPTRRCANWSKKCRSRAFGKNYRELRASGKARRRVGSK